LGFMPGENIGIVILTNLDSHMLMRALAYHVYDMLLNLDFQDWSKRYLAASKEETEQKEKDKRQRVKKEGANPRHKIIDYLGKYTSRLYGEVEIKMENELLKIRLSPHPHISGTIEHWQYDTFLVKWSDPGWGDGLIYFDLDNQGNIKQFRVSVRPDWIDTLEYTFVKNN
jgi:hypothetical protein